MSDIENSGGDDDSIAFAKKNGSVALKENNVAKNVTKTGEEKMEVEADDHDTTGNKLNGSSSPIKSSGKDHHVMNGGSGVDDEEDESVTNGKSTDDGETSHPVTDNGETSHPATDDGETSRPVTDDGDTSHPVTDDGETSHPVTDDGETSHPVTDDGETSHPVTDDGETSHPVTDDDSVQEAIPSTRTSPRKAIHTKNINYG